jgi:NADPH:quinone reductase-like Zn-dependent oxidoreductase
MNQTQQRALALLSTGISATQVAAAIGISDSAISQMVADPEFASQLVDAKFINLSKHTERDTATDALESKLLNKLDKTVDMIINPMQILKAYQIVNAAKRRAQQSDSILQNQAPTVSITVPVLIANQFTTDVNNQAISIGEHSLVTIQSGNVEKLASNLLLRKEIKNESNKLLTNSTERVSDDNTIST